MVKKENYPTIFITGSNGFLGRHLIKEFSDSPYRIVATPLSDNAIAGLDECIIFRKLDISNKEELKNIFNEFKPDFLINTSAVTNVEGYEKDKDFAYRVNVEAVHHMADLAKEFNTHLVQLSTDFVFDGKKGPYKEEDPRCPVNEYGGTKMLVEEVLENSGCSFAILRTILVYGSSDDQGRSNFVLWVKKCFLKVKK